MLVHFLAAAGQVLRHPCVRAERSDREKSYGPLFSPNLGLGKDLFISTAEAPEAMSGRDSLRRKKNMLILAQRSASLTLSRDGRRNVSRCHAPLPRSRLSESADAPSANRRLIDRCHLGFPGQSPLVCQAPRDRALIGALLHSPMSQGPRCCATVAKKKIAENCAAGGGVGFSGLRVPLTEEAAVGTLSRRFD